LVHPGAAFPPCVVGPGRIHPNRSKGQGPSLCQTAKGGGEGRDPLVDFASKGRGDGAQQVKQTEGPFRRGGRGKVRQTDGDDSERGPRHGQKGGGSERMAMGLKKGPSFRGKGVGRSCKGGGSYEGGWVGGETKDGGCWMVARQVQGFDISRKRMRVSGGWRKKAGGCTAVCLTFTRVSPANNMGWGTS